MNETVDEDQDYASAYEALVEFLYLAPVGIIKFRPDGIIEMANPTAAQLLMPLTSDGDMSDLYSLLSGLAPDLRAHVERFQEPAGQIFDQMQLVVPSTRSTLMLDINKIDHKTMMAVIQNITDLTDARRQILRETESQRLLASVFMRINTPVLVIRADGFILMANAAFQTLMGYDARSLIGLNIDALLPPECTGDARAARSQQMRDGHSYQVEMEIVAKDGTRSHVTMNSALLHENQARQSRVITLIPHTLTHRLAEEWRGSPHSAATLATDRSVNQVKVINLARIKTAVGLDWPHIASRALVLAEEMIKSLLGPNDILKRGQDNSFVIWFADGDPARNDAILARATQGVRHMFIAEFGTKIADRVRAAVAA